MTLDINSTKHGLLCSGRVKSVAQSGKSQEREDNWTLTAASSWNLTAVDGSVFVLFCYLPTSITTVFLEQNKASN